jgi:hypothetical protein
MLDIHDEGLSLRHTKGEVIVILESGRNYFAEYVGTHFLVPRLLVFMIVFVVLWSSVESIKGVADSGVGEMLAHSVVVSPLSE